MRTDTDLFYSDLLTLYGGIPQMRDGLTKNNSVPSLAGGTLWADTVNNVFYAFGGYFVSSQPSTFVTWSYNTEHGTWNVVPTQGDPSYVAHGMAAVAPDAGVGYYLGGYHDHQTQDGWNERRLYTSNLIQLDMVTRRYSNISGPNDRGRGEGLMVFIPASTSGLLIFFGGLTQDPYTGELSGVGSLSNRPVKVHA